MRTKIDPDETNEAKFRRLANHRVNRAVNTIKLVGNLSGYAHEAPDRDRIIAALTEAVNVVRVKFTSKGRKTRDEFSL